MQITRVLWPIILVVGIQQSSFASLEITPLEQYEYSDLMLVGIAKKDKVWFACFQAKDKQIFVAKQGTKIGRQLGHVAEIHAQYIKVSETFELNQGEWYKRSFGWPLVRESKFRQRCDSGAIGAQ